MDSYLGISDILNLVNTTIQTYTQTSYHALASALAPTMKLVLALYIGIFGIQHLTGQVAFEVWKTIKHLIVMVLVTTFVTRW